MTNPIGDRIIVKPIEENKQTESGLFIASKADLATPKGTVIAVGPGRTTTEGVLIPMQVSVGDTIVYANGSGISSKVNGEDVLFMTEDAVLGILSED
jgi:chaperonin GroES